MALVGLAGCCRVVIPLAAPGIAATALYGSILAWDEFIFARTFITSTNNCGRSPSAWRRFSGQYVTYWNDIMAACLIGTIPIVVLFIFTSGTSSPV